MGKSGGDVDLHMVVRQNFARALQGRTDDLADIVRRRIGLDRAGLKSGHVEQIGDEAIEPLQLLNDGCNQLHFAFAVQLRRQIP